MAWIVVKWGVLTWTISLFRVRAWIRLAWLSSFREYHCSWFPRASSSLNLKWWGSALSTPEVFEGDSTDLGFILMCLHLVSAYCQWDFFLRFAAFVNAWMIGDVMGSPSRVMVLMLSNLKMRIYVRDIIPLKFSRFFIRFSMSRRLEWLSV